MKIYSVGGSVRDEYMGKDPHDHDYVVVGSTHEEMIARGFIEVGMGFPVYLHPQTHEEYALARTEKKKGDGYRGFEVQFSPETTLEEDLGRRDLTVNAIAKDEDGNFIDPYSGRVHIDMKVLRHVTDDGFVEDPVRVLRVARFLARFGPEWSIARGTINLMKEMVDTGMMKHLTVERVMKEMETALMTRNPELFFEVLVEVGALKDIFPELDALVSATENPKWHPEGNAFAHTMLVLKQAVKDCADLEGRYAALLHDIGKGLTPVELLPKHHGHDVAGAKLIKQIAPKYLWNEKFAKKLALIARYHMNMHRLDEMNPKTFVKMFDSMGGLNAHDNVILLYKIGKWDARGRLGSEHCSVMGLMKLLYAYSAYSEIRFDAVFPNGETNPNKIKQEFFKARTKAVATYLKG